MNIHILNYLKCFCQSLAVSKEHQFTLITLKQILHFRIILIQLLSNLERRKTIVTVYSDKYRAILHDDGEYFGDGCSCFTSRNWPATQIAHL